jgi:hypothetical protein
VPFLGVGVEDAGHLGLQLKNVFCV